MSKLETVRKVHKKPLEIARIPPLEPIKFEKNEQAFLKPSSPEQIWENIYFTMSYFEKGGCFSKFLVQKILIRSVQILKKQPNVLYLSDPITIAGDIHGQLFDLIKHFQIMNLYSLIAINSQNSISKRRKVLFLGDYVDRGNFSVQVVMLLLLLKLYLPKMFFLLRGNHESKIITHQYNFRTQCLSKYDQQIYSLFVDFFVSLPLAAVVNGSFFCIHAGISQQLNSVEDIEKINRFKQIPITGLMCDLLWSDPIQTNDGRIIDDKTSIFNKKRECSIKYGSSLLKKYFRDNNFMCLIRAHEVQQQGYSFTNWQGQSRFPSIITLFSAPNYCGGKNKGAILSIDKNIIQVNPLTKIPQPFVLPNFIGAFELSFPFLIAQVTEFFFYLLKPFNQQDQQTNIDDFSSIESFTNLIKQQQRTIDKSRKMQIQAQKQLLKKQQILSNIYSHTKQYIQNNIIFSSRSSMTNVPSTVNKLKDTVRQNIQNISISQ